MISPREAFDQPRQCLGIVGPDNPKTVTADEVDLDRARAGPRIDNRRRIIAPGRINDIDRQETGGIRCVLVNHRPSFGSVWLSLDPYMRGHMDAGEQFTAERQLLSYFDL